MARRLLRWYQRSHRKLPWREHPTPYSVWVSEVMLQQTRVDTVVDKYIEFLRRFPTLETLAAATTEDVVTAWSGLGYYRRARSLHAGARAVLEHHGGEFPRDLDSALDLPGVGPYTAGAVLSIAYNQPTPAIDGNVERVVTRLLRLGEDPRKADVARKVRTTVAEWIPRKDASSFNQALMELGATVCQPRSPRCNVCPISENCLAKQEGDAESFPRKPRAQKILPVTLHAVAVQRGQKLLLQRVDEGSFLRGLWLFPFDVSAEAVQDHLEEATSARCSLAPLGTVRHAITFRRITLHTYRGTPSVRIPTKLPDGLGWFRREDFGRTVAVSSLALKVAKLLEHSPVEKS